MARRISFFGSFKQSDTKLEGAACYIFQCLTLARASVLNQSYLLYFKVFFFSLNMLGILKSRIQETLNLSMCIDRAIIHLPLANLPWLECPGPPLFWPFLAI